MSVKDDKMICDSLSDVKTTITHKNGYERSHCFLYDRPTCLSAYLCVCCICVSVICVYLLTLKGVQLKKNKKKNVLTNLNSITLITHTHKTHTHRDSFDIHVKAWKILKRSTIQSLNLYGVLGLWLAVDYKATRPTYEINKHKINTYHSD